MSVTSGMHGGASEMRRRVRMAGELHVPSAESGRVKVERETEIVVVKPKICTSWPNDVKPYLAALLRHPASAPATIDMMA